MAGKNWTQTIGRVAFLNCDPLFNGIDEKWEILPAPPSWLTGHLLRKDCIIAPIPTADYAANREELMLLPDIAIASNGEVGSVLVFSKMDLDDLKSVAIPSDSATSVSLLKHLLSRLNCEIEYEQMGPDLDSMLSSNDAALLIGDRALVEAENHPDLVKMDLGHEWMLETNLPMVFGVFAARRDSPIEMIKKAHSELVERLVNFETTGRQRVVEESAKRIGLDEQRVDKYFGEVLNRLDSKGELGLERFLREVCGVSQELSFF